jgi:hypothetical protein
LRLIDHLEGYLGAISAGWSTGPDGNPLSFQVARFDGGRLSDVVTFATIGLSNAGLASSKDGRLLYQELMVSCYTRSESGVFPGIVQQLGMMLLGQNRAVLRGEVLGPFGSIVQGSKLEAFYAAIPVYYDDAFAALDLESGKRVAMVWMVPVGRREAAYVREVGWRSFESKLADQDPDLLDFFRDEMDLD